MKLVRLDSVESTNKYCEALDLHQVEDFTCYWALEQTAGIGQRGNHWASAPGENLTFSLVLHPTSLAASRQFKLTQALSLALVDFMKEFREFREYKEFREFEELKESKEFKEFKEFAPQGDYIYAAASRKSKRACSSLDFRCSRKPASRHREFREFAPQGDYIYAAASRKSKRACSSLDFRCSRKPASRHREYKEIKEYKEFKEYREYKEFKESKEYKEYKEFKEFKNIKVKWPNDLYVGSNKICGTLVSTRLQGDTISSAVCGIGLNINQTAFPDWVPNPTSLRLLTGRSYDLEATLHVLLDCIRRRYDALCAGADMQQEYLAHLMNLGCEARYGYLGREITAVITGVDDHGRLLLDSSDGRRLCCAMKEITFLP